MNSSKKLQELLDSVVSNVTDRQELVDAIIKSGGKLTMLPAENSAAPPRIAASDETSQVVGANVDLGRAARCGFPEVVYAEGKPIQLVVDVFQAQQDANQHSLATRVSPEQAVALTEVFPNAIYNKTARTVRRQCSHEGDQNDEENIPQVAVVTAGSCDLPVALEAVETLAWMDVPWTLIEDVGVAGPQRLLKHVPLLQQMDCVVCVAGMEAALPSVLGGHVHCPVIGVPTSVGYGASFMGLAALLSMLNSCSSNVVTVNIDAGFRGGYVGGMIAATNTSPTENRS